MMLLVVFKVGGRDDDGDDVGFWKGTS